MQYLAKWRMQIASELLTGGNAKVATVAVEIGYASEAAFSRAVLIRVAPILHKASDLISGTLEVEPSRQTSQRR
jgi:methylphosphotriester-DNA--protein-cysteine methyltransferase